MMVKYKILPHKADVKIKVFGKDKKELFKNALFAMADILRAKVKTEKPQIRDFKIASDNLEILLVDFLNEALYLSQVNKEIYLTVNFEKFENDLLFRNSNSEIIKEPEGRMFIKGKMIGKKVKNFEEDIKAATYHNLSVRQIRDKTWEATVLFDI